MIQLCVLSGYKTQQNVQVLDQPWACIFVEGSEKNYSWFGIVVKYYSV